ncbi:hypothetical protein BDN70DRAFT_998356 [Pholiota conissans]|uniref:Uncharacterized protein n=1 Tax=Pholiota conissans TaxID=109636 RepID=A0A9P6CTF3_9AGAR|nr:hypothetical protein BDN70DRAFT_998356 [Pholiota conissans]
MLTIICAPSALSPPTMSSSSQNVVPAEVIDLIVDEIAKFSDDRMKKKTLASLALVSWYCRSRAHGHLFSSLYILDYQNGRQRVQALLHLIEADPQSEESGIASYVRSLTIQLIGQTNKIRIPFDDGSLARIFRKIFRKQNKGPFSLSLLCPPREGIVRKPFDWTTLNADFLSTFYDLLGNPSFDTLHLAHFGKLPRNLLHHSFIRNLKIEKLHLDDIDNDEEIPEEVRFGLLEDEPGICMSDEGQAVPLESIDTDHSVPLLYLIDKTSQKMLHPKFAFSRLNRLIVRITSAHNFVKTRWIFVNAASTLKRMDIILFTSDELPEHEASELLLLPELQSISIIQNSTSYKFPGRSRIPQICRFMEHLTLHPNLKEVKISMFLYSHPDLASRTAAEIFNGHDLAPFDQLFSRSNFNGLKRLIIRFMFNLIPPRNGWDLRAFQEACREHVRRFFELSEASHAALIVELQFDIRTIRFDYEQISVADPFQLIFT